MGGFTGIWQWVIVLVIVLLLFGGRGKISQLMGDLGKGLKSFKKSMQSDDESKTTAQSQSAETVKKD
jgi:sec-independent protein translocase protein TatA